MTSNQNSRPSPDALARAALGEPETLGLVIPTTSTRQDAPARPRLGPGQVFITRGGKRFHDSWCNAIHGTYKETPSAVLVIPAADIGDRTRCAVCDVPKPVIPAADVRHDVTGRPVLADGQAYVTRKGKRFHPAWCGTIADTFDRWPKAVIVTAVEDTGDRTRCANCDNPLTG